MSDRTKDNILEFIVVLVIVGIIFAWLYASSGGN